MPILSLNKYACLFKICYYIHNEGLNSACQACPFSLISRLYHQRIVNGYLLVPALTIPSPPWHGFHLFKIKGAFILDSSGLFLSRAAIFCSRRPPHWKAPSALHGFLSRNARKCSNNGAEDCKQGRGWLTLGLFLVLTLTRLLPLAWLSCRLSLRHTGLSSRGKDNIGAAVPALL